MVMLFLCCHGNIFTISCCHGNIVTMRIHTNIYIRDDRRTTLGLKQIYRIFGICLTEAASLLELAYNDYANSHQREALTREFYGVIVSFDCGIEIINDGATLKAVGDEKQSKVI